jgi:hypothetical protein
MPCILFYFIFILESWPYAMLEKISKTCFPNMALAKIIELKLS